MVLKAFLSHQPFGWLTSNFHALVNSLDLWGWGLKIISGEGASSKGGVNGLCTLKLLLDLDN